MARKIETMDMESGFMEEEFQEDGSLVDINIYFSPIPSKDFDDLEEGMEVDDEKIYDEWVRESLDIIKKIHPDSDCIQVYVQDLDRDDNTCTIQFTFNEEMNGEQVSEDSYEDKVKEFLEIKYPDTKVEVLTGSSYTT